MTDAAQMAVAAGSVVKHFDVIEDAAPGELAGLVNALRHDAGRSSHRLPHVARGRASSGYRAAYEALAPCPFPP